MYIVKKDFFYNGIFLKHFWTFYNFFATQLQSIWLLLILMENETDFELLSKVDKVPFNFW